MISNSDSPTEFEFIVSQDIQLDLILEQINDWSEGIDDFVEEEYFKTRWLQILEADNDDVILHLFFEDNQEYLYSLDGDILFRGFWKTLNENNSLIIDRVVNQQVTKSELFDLAYLSPDFFILKKHGDQKKKGKAKYLFLGREDLVENLEHDEILTFLRNEGGNSFSWNTIFMIGILVILLAVVLKYIGLL